MQLMFKAKEIRMTVKFQSKNKLPIFITLKEENKINIELAEMTNRYTVPNKNQ